MQPLDPALPAECAQDMAAHRRLFELGWCAASPLHMPPKRINPGHKAPWREATTRRAKGPKDDVVAPDVGGAQEAIRGVARGYRCAIGVHIVQNGACTESDRTFARRLHAMARMTLRSVG